MHDFKYRGEEFYCGKVKVSDVERAVGTPFYLYSHRTLLDHYNKLRKAFKPVSPLICFSMKANSNLALCRALVKRSAGIDIVSGGELFRAQRAGCPPKRIVYASVGKTEKEIESAMRAGILLFNVESRPELEMIEHVANRLNRRQQVSIRVNPDIDPHTHGYITTGKAGTKFGLDIETVRAVFADGYMYPHLLLKGLHIHIGSQITESKPFIRAVKKVLPLIKELKGVLEYLNIGGGLGIVYNNEKPQTAETFARVILPYLKKTGLKIILEPGRFIVGNAGVLVTKVLYVKETKLKDFIIVDAGMNDLIRPSLYGAYHEIVPAVKTGRMDSKTSDVVGPICESGDFLAKDRRMSEVQPGELLVALGAGAYGFTMSSNYNSRPRLPEVLVKGDKFFVVRKRESLEDLIRGETIPKGI